MTPIDVLSFACNLIVIVDEEGVVMIINYNLLRMCSVATAKLYVVR